MSHARKAAPAPRTTARLALVALALAGALSASARADTLEVHPVVIDERSGQAYARVTLESDEGEPLEGRRVQFIPAAGLDASFPLPSAVTGPDGVAWNLVVGVRPDEPFQSHTLGTFIARSGDLESEPATVQWEGFHGDGTDGLDTDGLGAFSAPGATQVLSFRAGGFFFEVGQEIFAWSSDPTIASIEHGRVVDDPACEFCATIDFVVTAHGEGEVVLMTGTANHAVYLATGGDAIRISDVPPTTWVRGDVDADGSTAITDAIVLLQFLFLGGDALLCLDAADADDDGHLNVTDAIRILGALFIGVDPIPAPTGACGTDPTEDDLGCDSFTACA